MASQPTQAIVPSSLVDVQLCELQRGWRFWGGEDGGPAPSLDAVVREECVVVVGAAGMGKTAELFLWFLRSSGATWVDLGLIESAAALEQVCGAGSTVFIDGCDEFAGKAGPLFEQFRVLLDRGTRLRISSRTSWWASNCHLHARLGQSTVLELEPLSNVGARLLLESGGLETGRLGLYLRASEALTRNPRMLLALCRAADMTGGLLPNRVAIYEQLALEAANERNSGVSAVISADPGATLAGAKLYAAILVLTGRTIMTGELIPERDERLSISDDQVRTLLPAWVNQVDLSWILRSQLMTPCDGGYRFTDRSMIEYLAAKGICEFFVGRADENAFWDQLVTMDVGGEKFVPPRLRGFAAWAAELSGQAFDVVFRADPQVLIEHDLLSHGDTSLRRLFEAMINDDQLTRTATYSKGLLAAAYRAADGHSEISRRMQHSAYEVRRRALEYVSGAEIRDFDDEIVALLSDPMEDEVIRYWAAASISTEMGPGRLITLRSVLLGPAAPTDPDHRIRGMLLKVLWPNYITAEHLFASLVPQTSAGFLEYESFLAKDLIRHLPEKEVDLALLWVAELSKSYEWRQWPRDSVIEAIRQLVRQRLAVLAEGEGRNATVIALARTVGVFDERRTTVLEPGVNERLSARDLVVMTNFMVSEALGGDQDDVAVFRVARVARDLDPAIAGDFARWLYDRVRLNDRSEWSHWLDVLEGALDPARDRQLVEDMLALDNEQRVPFARLVNEVRIDSVPDWRRRRPTTPTEDVEAPLQSLVSRLVRDELTWVDFIYAYVDAFHSYRCLVDEDEAGQIADSSWVVLERAANEYVTEYQEPLDFSRDSGSVTLGELALGHALAVLGFRDRLDDFDSRLEAHTRTVFRCGEFFRSPAYDRVVVMSHDRDPDGYLAIACETISRARDDGVTISMHWLKRYPQGAPPVLINAAVALAVESSADSQRRAQLLSELAASHPEAVRKLSVRILEAFEGTPGFGKAFVALLEAGEPLSMRGLETISPASAREAIAALAGSEGRSPLVDHLLETMSSADLGWLYRLASRLFERASFEDGWFGDREHVDDLRSRCLHGLAQRGPEGVGVLRTLSDHGTLRHVLGGDRLRQLLDDWWEPFKQYDLIAFLTNPTCEVIRSPSELLGAVRRGLEAYEQSLHAIGGGSELLWEANRPRRETDLSIDMMRFLRQHFLPQRMVLNREVELRPANECEAIAGERSDILVQAISDEGRTMSLVIEIKGSWNKHKYTGYRRQLVDRYLAHPDVDAGLHVVYWFDQGSWTDDARKKKSPRQKTRIGSRLSNEKPICDKPVDHVVVDASRDALVRAVTATTARRGLTR